MPLDQAHALHQHLAPFAVDIQNTAGLALIAAGDDLHRIVFLNLDFQLGPGVVLMPRSNLRVRHNVKSPRRLYITSGASETIFIYFLSRNSRATGPNTRVPIGSPISDINTAAFESKRIYVPSLRRVSLRIRTIT